MSGKKKETMLPISTFDSLFSTQEQRDDEQLVKIREIPISKIDDFPEHPFKVLDDEDMDQLVESIKERGVITPATVHLKEDGSYEMISGHRRKRACEIAGLDTLRCEVVDVTKEEAIVLMVESNLSQRTVILPSEKAFAYKMRLEAMNRQGQRNDLTSDPLGPKLKGSRSNAALSDEVSESASQIKRYIRLTNLIPELLDIVDEGKMKLRPAVEISYINENCQHDLLTEIELDEATPSHDQAKRMRELFEKNSLTPAVIQMIMKEVKPNQREKLVLHGDRVRKLIPQNIPEEQTEDYICKALDHYRNYMRSRAARDSR